MEVASSNSIVHRDLAARNVLVFGMSPPVVKLADFGSESFALHERQHHGMLTCDQCRSCWLMMSTIGQWMRSGPSGGCYRLSCHVAVLTLSGGWRRKR